MNRIHPSFSKLCLVKQTIWINIFRYLIKNSAIFTAYQNNQSLHFQTRKKFYKFRLVYCCRIIKSTRVPFLGQDKLCNNVK